MGNSSIQKSRFHRENSGTNVGGYKIEKANKRQIKIGKSKLVEMKKKSQS
jgi:hypothetical protein